MYIYRSSGCFDCKRHYKYNASIRKVLRSRRVLASTDVPFSFVVQIAHHQSLSESQTWEGDTSASSWPRFTRSRRRAKQDKKSGLADKKGPGCHLLARLENAYSLVTSIWPPVWFAKINPNTKKVKNHIH